MFLGLHFYIVTMRLATLLMGGHPMKATFAWPVAIPEVVRAARACDCGLLAIAVAWIVVPRLKGRMKRSGEPPSRERISGRRALVFALISLAVGVVGMAVAGRIEHGVRNTSWDTSGYMSATATWASWSACLLHYAFGFRKQLLVLTGCSLLAVGFTNPSRFGVVIPLVFLLLLAFARRRSKSIPLTIVPALIAIVLLWLPMKPLAQSLHDGMGIQEAASFALSVTTDNFASKKEALMINS